MTNFISSMGSFIYRIFLFIRYLRKSPDALRESDSSAHVTLLEQRCKLARLVSAPVTGESDKLGFSSD
jgi:hypothetical protein